MVRGILFDLDGVLVDSREVWYQVMQAAARHFGHPEIPRQTFLDTFGQGVDADIRLFFPGTGYRELDAFYDLHFQDYLEHFLVNPSAQGVLEALRARGLARVIVTNTSGPLARDILTWTKLEPDRLLGSTDVARPKPAPDLLLKAMEWLDMQTHEVLMVGDSEFDRDAAREAGVRFLGYGGIEGDVTLGSLEDLLGVVDDLVGQPPGSSAQR